MVSGQQDVALHIGEQTSFVSLFALAAENSYAFAPTKYFYDSSQP